MTVHFDRLAPWYDRLIAPPAPQALVSLLALPAEGWLLDVGGGTGRASALLRPFVDGVLVSDLSEPMLQAAQQKGGLSTVRASVLALPHASNSITRLLVVDAFHHFPAQRRALAELLRVLHPGGRLLIQEPDIHHPVVKLIALAERLIGMQSRFVAGEEIATMARSLGATAALHHDAPTTLSILIEKQAPGQNDPTR